MALGNYRKVLSLPGVGPLLALMLVARIPISATSMVLTLHVVLTLHGTYGAAGLVGAAGTIGVAVGAPISGRMVDAWGLRRMVSITTVAYGAYWLTAWLLPYPALLVLSFFGGILALPVMSIGRQSLAALVPEEHRRAAFSLDSMSVEVSFMVGPAMGVLVATKVSTVAAVVTVGVMLVLGGLAVYLVNPPVRGAHDDHADGTRPARREWLRSQMLATLALSAGAVFVLAGTEVAAVAALRGSGEIGWTGVVTIAMCVASLIGGLVYGAIHHSPPALVLLALLGGLVVPVGLAGGQWWALCLALVPSSVMCAPTLAAGGDLVSRLAPAAVRGEAMGLLSGALTLGAAMGAPVVGSVVDHFGAGGGFAAAGMGGVLVAALLIPFSRRSRPGRRTEAAMIARSVKSAT